MSAFVVVDDENTHNNYTSQLHDEYLVFTSLCCIRGSQNCSSNNCVLNTTSPPQSHLWRAVLPPLTAENGLACCMC